MNRALSDVDVTATQSPVSLPSGDNFAGNASAEGEGNVCILVKYMEGLPANHTQMGGSRLDEGEVLGCPVNARSRWERSFLPLRGKELQSFYGPFQGLSLGTRED